MCSPKVVINEIDEDPFKDLKISENWKMLTSLNERSVCSKCNRSRKYFCYNCYIPVSELRNYVPKVKLPLKIDIIKHAREIDGKSTAAHAAVLAPEDVSIYTYPCVPDYQSDYHHSDCYGSNVVLIYPSKDATSVSSLIKDLISRRLEKNIEEPGGNKKRRCSNNSGLQISKVISTAVFIDATWNQSKAIYKDPRLSELPCVVLRSRISQFWRHQKGSPRWYLATIEAIHQFLIEVHSCFPTVPHRLVSDTVENSTGESSNLGDDYCASEDPLDFKLQSANYNGEYDNLLFFFYFMYNKIHTLYLHDDLLSYKRPLD